MITVTKSIQINDEPFLEDSTGVRSAAVKYTGHAYVYVEASKSTGKILTRIYSSDVQDMEKALEHCNTGDEDLVCVELNPNDNLLEICFTPGITSKIEVIVPKYTETLPDGTEWELEYLNTEVVALYDIFNVQQMVFDIGTKKFQELKFKTHISDENFLKSIDASIERVSVALEENTYSEEDLEKITAYKDALVQFRADYDGTVKFWKLKIPTLDIPY